MAVVVVGDLARSPRMVNHAREFARHGCPVSLVGLREKSFTPPDGVRVVALPTRARASSLPFLLSAFLRMARTFFDLTAALRRLRPDIILLQNPPAFPTLAAGRVAARLTGARLAVDWHNYGFSMLGLRLGSSHPVTRFAGWWEGAMARHAAVHFCVSRAMQADLIRRFGITATTLPDLPLELGPDRPAGSPLVVVCPAGWTADENMALLLDALDLLPASKLEIHLTGDGPLRQTLEPRIGALRARGLNLHTGYLSDADYLALLRRADLGISMHTSSSGLDLAMKVVDLFAARVPVCAFDYQGSLPEQIEPNQTGFLFRTAPELAAILTAIEADPAPLADLRRGISVRWRTTWSENWKQVVHSRLGLR